MDTTSKEYRKEFQLACEHVKIMRQQDKLQHKLDEQAEIAKAKESQRWFSILRAGV